MTLTLTSDQVLALAPDAASARAGAALATPRQWVQVGADGDRAVWGECRGSGAQPYQTRVDLDGPAFRCSCPSRKLPCKHVLGLLLLHAGSSALFAPGEPPPWVAEWLAERRERTERRATRADASASAPPDVAAQARRAEARTAKVDAGMAELALWLRDLVRAGLAAAPSRPASYWDGMAARLVDAQAPGAGRQVRRLGAIPTSGDGWPERLLARVARLHLLVEAYGRLDRLPAPLQADVRAQIGWSPGDAELDAAARVADGWTVIGQAFDEDERLRVRRTWLVGRDTGRTALLLHFAHGTAPFAEPVPPVGGGLGAELAFHPGAFPQRAVVVASAEVAGEATGPATRPALPRAQRRLRDATTAYAAALAANPWVERVPLVLDVVPERAGDGWQVRDEAGDALPLSRRCRAEWQLLALSGGRPLWLAAEWDGESLLPLAASADGGRPVPLVTPAAA